MKPMEFARWEVSRSRGFRHFVLTYGLLKCGTIFLVLGLFSMLLAFVDARRVTTEIGWTTLKFTDYLAILLRFSPRLLLFAVGGGVLFALVMWYAMEYLYRRAQQSGGRA